MGRVGETWRGGSTLAAWLGGMPLFNARVLATTNNRAEAREAVAARGERALRRCGWTVELDGPIPPPGTGCVIQYNESSFPDSYAYAVVLARHADRSASADVYTWVPLTRAAWRRAAVIEVPRGSRAGTDKALAEAVEAARAGERVAWGGEGGFTGKDEVGRFKVGGALIAIRAGVPLVPIAFRGAHAVMPLGSYRARPGTLKVRFGDPIPSTGYTEEQARELADRVQAAVAALHASLA